MASSYWLIICIIVVIILMYIYNGEIASLWNKETDGIYTLVGENPVLLDDTYSLAMTVGELVGTARNLNTPDSGNGITLFCKMHVINAPSNSGWTTSYTTLKPIICIGESPQLHYDAHKSQIVLIVKYKDNPYYPHFENIVIDFPQQKWTDIQATISDRVVRVYMDGILAKYVMLDNVAIITNHVLDVVSVGASGNNIQGSIRDVAVKFGMP